MEYTKCPGVDLEVKIFITIDSWKFVAIGLQEVHMYAYQVRLTN
jgi:hypothetical protein